MNDFIVLSAFALFVVFIAGIYNRVIRKRNAADKAFGTMEILLKKRYDLLPNLVEITKQYARFEANVVPEIQQIIAQLSLPSPSERKIELHSSLNRQLNIYMGNLYSQPELKTSQHFLRLQAAWNEAEEQISAARRYYNAAVAEYNNSLQTFPANILMNKNRFSPRPYLEFDTNIRDSVSATRLFNQ